MFDKQPYKTLTIHKELKNGNQGRTKHWSSADRERRQWRDAVDRCGINHLDLPSSDQPWKAGVEVVRVLGKGQREWDPDSILRGNAKELIDTLVELRHIIEDDSAKWVAWAVGTQDVSRRSDGPITVVHLYQVFQ